MVWVNGHAMGRFWEIGPQQTLYMPGCWLKEGDNEIIVLDLKGPAEAKVAGVENRFWICCVKSTGNTSQRWTEPELES